MSRSPIELIDAVLDEVEGLRQTDPRSFLPGALLRQLRDATATSSPASSGLTSFNDLDELVGRTITHVFKDDLRRGDVLVVCSDGGFVVLEAEPDGEDAYITTVRTARAIHDYLRPAALHGLGLISAEDRQAAEKKEQIEAAERVLARARAQVKHAEELLAKLKPTDSAAAPPQATEPGAVDG